MTSALGRACDELVHPDQEAVAGDDPVNVHQQLATALDEAFDLEIFTTCSPVKNTTCCRLPVRPQSQST